MKKILFKVCLIILVIFSLNITANAKTLRDLKNELAELEKKRDENKRKENLTKQEMNQINGRISDITAQTEKSEQKISELSDEIVVLQEKTDEKKEDIKDVVSFLQVTNSNNAYLEYIFGATSVTDLIFRSAISEQLVNYNNELITEYNETVKECTEKKEELQEEIVALEKEQENLKAELVKLGDTLSSIVGVYIDIDNDISTQKKMIDYYQNTLGCKDDEDITTCGGNIPYSGKMIRPVASGRVTSEFSWRTDPFGSGATTFHSGIDVAGGATDVYAVAPGTVAGISWKNSCGGTMLFIHHNINGVYYTTGFYHLYQVYVSVGDYVDQNTKIGVTGGTRSLTPWDSCSTGRHMHLSIATGLYLKQYSAWSTYTSRLVNPRTMINFPPKGVWFSNRVTTY